MTDESSAIVPASNAGKNVAVAKRRRPARIQAEARPADQQVPPQTGQVFNIWYGKWAGGDREDAYISKQHSEYRCVIAKDSGFTKADRVPGAYFCLQFARGMCPNGPDCNFLHRLPTVHDMFSPNVDCFGRDKHADYRDDMGGVGSFMRQNHTIYVGRIHVSDEIEEVVARHFAEWGEVERIRVLNSRGVAFVTYVNQANAQFAKEAMAHQSLDHNEILNVRWATQDPNPLAQKRDARRLEEQAAEAIRRALPAEFVAELEGRDPDAKRKRKIEGSFGLKGYEVPDEVWYSRGSNAVNPAVQQAQLDAPEQRLQIEAPPAKEDDGSIFSSSTLSALRTLTEKTGATVAPVPAKEETKPAGLAGMLDYGSDDDSD
ncbi:Pre-mRNA-splicing factor [Saitoella coloradoensis]